MVALQDSVDGLQRGGSAAADVQVQPGNAVALHSRGQIEQGKGLIGQTKIQHAADLAVWLRGIPEQIGGMPVVVGPQGLLRGEQRIQLLMKRQVQALQVSTPIALAQVRRQCRIIHAGRFNGRNRVGLAEQTEVGQQHRRLTRRRSKTAGSVMQTGQALPGCPGMLIRLKRRPRQRLTIEVLPGSDLVHFIRPLAKGNGRVALSTAQHLGHRRAVAMQMDHKAMLFAQPLRLTHRAVMTFDKQRLLTGGDQAGRRERTRAVPVDLTQAADRRVVTEQLLNRRIANRGPVGLYRLQSHAMSTAARVCHQTVSGR